METGVFYLSFSTFGNPNDRPSRREVRGKRPEKLLDDAMFEPLKQVESSVDGRFNGPSAQLGIAPDAVFIEVAAVNDAHEVLQTSLIVGPSVGEMRAVDVDHGDSLLK